MRPSRRSVLAFTTRDRSWALLLALLMLSLAGCDSGTEPPAGSPGTVTYRLASPNGAEGGLLVSVSASEVGGVGGGDALTQVISSSSGGTMYVAVIHRFGTETLGFELAVDDRNAPPSVTLVEVVGPDDRQRSLSGYSLEIVP